MQKKTPTLGKRTELSFPSKCAWKVPDNQGSALTKTDRKKKSDKEQVRRGFQLQRGGLKVNWGHDPKKNTMRHEDGKVGKGGVHLTENQEKFKSNEKNIFE